MFGFLLKPLKLIKFESSPERENRITKVEATDSESKEGLLFAATDCDGPGILWALSVDKPYNVSPDTRFYFDPFYFEPQTAKEKEEKGLFNFDYLTKQIKDNETSGIPQIFKEYSYYREDRKYAVSETILRAAVNEGEDSIFRTFITTSVYLYEVEMIRGTIDYIMTSIKLHMLDARRYKNDSARVGNMCAKIMRHFAMLNTAIFLVVNMASDKELLQLLIDAITNGVYSVSVFVFNQVSNALFIYGSEFGPETKKWLKSVDALQTIFSTSRDDPLFDNKPLFDLLVENFKKKEAYRLPEIAFVTPKRTAIVKYMIERGFFQATHMEDPSFKLDFNPIEISWLLDSYEPGSSYFHYLLPHSGRINLQLIWNSPEVIKILSKILKMITADKNETFASFIQEPSEHNVFKFLRERPYVDLILLVTIKEIKFGLFSKILESLPIDCYVKSTDLSQNDIIKALNPGLALNTLRDPRIFLKMKEVFPKLETLNETDETAARTMIDCSLQVSVGSGGRVNILTEAFTWAFDLLNSIGQEPAYLQPAKRLKALTVLRSICESKEVQSLLLPRESPAPKASEAEVGQVLDFKEDTSYSGCVNLLERLAPIALKILGEYIFSLMSEYWTIVHVLARFFPGQNDQAMRFYMQYLSRSDENMRRLVEPALKTISGTIILSWYGTLSERAREGSDEDKYVITMIEKTVGTLGYEKTALDFDKLVLSDTAITNYINNQPRIVLMPRPTASLAQLNPNNNNNNNNAPAQTSQSAIERRLIPARYNQEERENPQGSIVISTSHPTVPDLSDVFSSQLRHLPTITNTQGPLQSSVGVIQPNSSPAPLSQGDLVPVQPFTAHGTLSNPPPPKPISKTTSTTGVPSKKGPLPSKETRSGGTLPPVEETRSLYPQGSYLVPQPQYSETGTSAQSQPTGDIFPGNSVWGNPASNQGGLLRRGWANPSSVNPAPNQGGLLLGAWDNPLRENPASSTSTQEDYLQRGLTPSTITNPRGGQSAPRRGNRDFPSSSTARQFFPYQRTQGRILTKDRIEDKGQPLPQRMRDAHNYGNGKTASAWDVYVQIDLDLGTSNSGYLKSVKALQTNASNVIVLGRLVESMDGDLSPGVVSDTTSNIVRAFLTETESSKSLIELWNKYIAQCLKIIRTRQFEFLGKIMEEALLHTIYPRNPRVLKKLFSALVSQTETLRMSQGLPELRFYDEWCAAFTFALIETDLSVTRKTLGAMLQMGFSLEEDVALYVNDAMTGKQTKVSDTPLMLLSRYAENFPSRLPKVLDIITSEGKKVPPVQTMLLWRTENWRVCAASGLIPDRNYLERALVSREPDEETMSLFERSFDKFETLNSMVSDQQYRKELKEYMESMVLGELRLGFYSEDEVPGWAAITFSETKDAKRAVFLFKALAKVAENPVVLSKALEMLEERGWYNEAEDLRSEYNTKLVSSPVPEEM